MTRLSSRQTLPAIIIALTMAVIFIAGNSSLRPDLMEVRNLVTAREMVYDQHIMVPTMNGELRLEKPPLPTWIAAAVEYVMPDSITAQRCVAAIMAMLWAMWLYLFTKAVTKNSRFSLLVLLLFATCYPVILHARTATWDVFCHSFMMGAIYHTFLALYGQRSEGKHFVVGGLLFGLSFMSKGPVSAYALFLPFIIGALCYRRPAMRGKYAALVLGIVIALVVSSWWYVYLMVFEPEAISRVMGKESGSWINHNVRPWHYYWRFFAETGIWSVLMLSSLFLWFKRKRALDMETSRQWTFFFVWTLAALVLLSLMPEKKMRYLLPMMVPCSLCMAYAVSFISKGTPLGNTVFAINKWALAIVVLVVPAAIYYFIVRSGQMSIFAFVVFTLGCLAAVVALMLARRARQARRLVVTVYALFVWIALFIMPNLDSIFGNVGARKITSLKNDTTLKEMPMLYVNAGEHQFRIDMVYLTHHKIKEITANGLFSKDGDSFSPTLPLPCAVLSDSATAADIRRVAQAEQIVCTDYGSFDDNISKDKGAHYKIGLCNYLTVLRKK